jgi:HD-GYP domain-containing protein (c-di-GMP phosphodiesterase class II)
MTTNPLPIDTATSSSVLKGLNRINTRLDKLLTELPSHSNAAPELRQIAGQLVLAVAQDADIALAAILLNQIAGRYAVRHCVETAIVATVLARAMGKTEDEVLTVSAAALTMNVGMMRQIENFQTRDSVLSHEERALVQRHPGESANLLRWAGVTDDNWLACVLQHHENNDGSGYPEGKMAPEIPENASLIGLADRYCACVSARNYRRSMLPPLALGKLCDEAATAAGTALAALLAAQLGPYPPGTLVRLAGGAIGVVSQRGSSETTVAVHALRNAAGEPIPAALARGRDGAEVDIIGALHEDEAKVRFSMQAIWGDMASL